ncbi:SusD/RagB family nutrient-binding outer membrane lipoprotein [Marinigracilibium pacificum]|uniref:SusD/RagB family nutrient-binding outer membrane lipoprotein n=1 Tax=Marinigracilibium pacificum TaxID=2729599 RepID=A0A848IW36_9BACT|nr:SusD/RagB family nutrient-binding outer membrane lipoprotein [Marinigracilibium pacificum]NMM48547.1 SusD/RagB family nutrient-binding outer membrane lipoprotein [Marinigracilibium pacificum]
MKKLISILIIVVIAFACDDRLDELNTDKKNPAQVPASSLFSNGLKNSFDILNSIDVNENVFNLYIQYFTTTTYPEETRYNLTSRTIPENFWFAIYVDALADLNEAKKLINVDLESEPPNAAELNNQLALITFLEAFMYSTLVDVFGNVPYTEALNPDNITPAYDDAESIYDDLVARIDAALNSLDMSEPAFGPNQDILYHDDLSLWVKFANTLKFRMGMRLADYNSTKSQSWVNSALAGGVFESNADNAALSYQSIAPNTNPVYVDLVLSGRQDFILAETIGNRLNELRDPRITAYVTPVAFAYKTDENSVKLDSTITNSTGYYIVWEAVDGTDSLTWRNGTFTVRAADADKNPRVFKGGKIGANNSYVIHAKVGPALYANPSLPGTIMSYAEVEFLMAECVERGGYNVTGTAEEHYNAGILASFNQWGVDGYDDYIMQPNVAYNTAAGDWKNKIGRQLWLSQYDMGVEAWNSWKRLDHDAPYPLDGDTEVTIPYRFTYPLIEDQLNGVNVTAASNAIGGDEKYTKIFWDVN